MVNNDEIKGKLNEMAGKLTDDERKELKGKAQGAFGKMKEDVKEKTDEIAGKANDSIDRATAEKES